MSARASFWLRIAIAVAAMFVLAPLFGPLFPEEPFHRVMTRVLQGAVVVALMWGAGPPRTWRAKTAAMGFRGPDRTRRFLFGAAVGIGATAVLLLVSWALGGRAPVDGHRLTLAEHLLRAVVAGVAVSFFEEVLVRGYMKNAIGGLQSALLFAAVHYCRPLAKPGEPKSLPAGDDYDPLLAFKRAGDLFEAWSVPRYATLGVLSLFLFALALNRLRERTGTLYVGIGLHAGLVFVLDLYRRFLESDVADPWVFGGSRLHDGLLGTAALAVVLLWAHRGPLPRAVR